MAAIFNFLGILFMSLVNSKVAKTIFNLVDLSQSPNLAVLALSAALISIIVWTLFAENIGIPTSESHALVASLSGAAIGIANTFSVINITELKKVFIGIILSIVLGFTLGFIIAKIIETIFRYKDRRKTIKKFKIVQIWRITSINFKVVKNILLAGIVTFPCCGLLAYLICKTLIIIF